VDLLIQAPASAAVLAGTGQLYLAWRGRAGRGGRWRADVAVGWLLIAAGVVGWGCSMSPDLGVPLAAVLAMCAALAAIAVHSLATEGPARGERGRVRAEPDGLELGAGYRGRFAVRLGSSLLLAPGLGVLAGLAWAAYGPGQEATRLIGLAFTAVGVMAAALVIQLMSPRPWRTAAGLAAATGVTALAILLAPIRGAG
jgi:hypothetical protein